MHGMREGFMFFNGFWIILLIGAGVIAVLAGIAIKRLLGHSRTASFPDNTLPAGKIPAGKLPEEFKKSGEQILEHLDWEIRFLEKQRLETDVPADRQRIETELKLKKDEYQTVVERLQP